MWTFESNFDRIFCYDITQNLHRCITANLMINSTHICFVNIIERIAKFPSPIVSHSFTRSFSYSTLSLPLLAQGDRAG